MLLGLLYTLYLAKAVIVPLVLAILLSMLLAPLVRLLARFHIPPGLGAGLVLAAMLGGLGVAAAFIVEPAGAWARTIPDRLPELRERLEAFRQPLETVHQASEQVEHLAEFNQPKNQAVVSVRGATPAGLVLSQTPAFLANLAVMFILLYFLLASGDLFLRKLVRLIPTFSDKRRTVEIAREIEDRISRYLRTVTLINLALGAAVGLAALLIGMPNFVLWGALAFLLNFIPYVGALVGVVATLVAGLLTFPSIPHALFLPAAYLALNTLEGNFLTPLIVGRILTLNPVIIFVSLMFWGWIWGIAGALLAVPILAAFKIICDHLHPLRPIGAFIGDDPDPANV